MSSKKQIVTARAGWGFLILALTLWAGSPHAAAGRSDALQRSNIAAPGADLKHSPEDAWRAYMKLPIAFVENRGQADGRVRFYAQGNRYAFFLTSRDIVLSFEDAAASQALALRLRFVGGNRRASLEGAERLPGEVNYLHGSDPAGWRTQLPRYGQIVYRELWPGIDLRLNDATGTLKYEFRVRPGANPANIQLAYSGADSLSLDSAGAMLINTSMGVLKDAPPVSYQTIDNARVPVESAYTLATDTSGRTLGYAFKVGAYRADRELVIDPGLEYSTFLGGNSHEIGAGIKVDANGNAYVVGTTQSPNFPTRPGSFDRTGAASNSLEAFVTKVNPTGTALVYSTYIGGGNFEWGRGIAIDAAGSAYVTGQTKSSNFPTTGGAFDRTFNVDTCPRCGIDQYDAFVLKLNAAGSALVYSTFLGGFNLDDGMAIAVDGSGNAYVAGETEASNFPTTAGAFDRTINGAFDTFVTRLNATGSALVYSTYLGGAAVEFPSRVAVGADQNLFIAGSTSSTNFPTTAGAFDTTQNGAFDAFVTKLNAAGSGLVFSTFLGGSGSDSSGGLALDAAGNSYVSGGTGSVDFPTTPGAFDTLPDGSDAFVTKFNPGGSALVYSTVVGGTGSEGASGLALDGAGNAWITGATGSADFPIIVGAVDSTHNGMADVFVSELNADGSTLLYSTFLGGSQTEVGNDIAVDTSGGAYVTGHTYSANYPTTAGAFDIVFNGDLLIFWGDAFISKIGAVSTPPSTPPEPAAPTLISPANGENAAQPITFQWNVASGAVSYTIQIDDSSAFSAPLVREQQNITTLLMYATSGLSTATHFWRVRGVNTAGVAGPWSAVRTVIPGQAPPPPGLGSLDLNPATVEGGNASFGTVVLSTGAPFGGAVINLSSSNPAVASVPATTTAPENSFTAGFTIATSPVSANTPVTITASYNGTTRTATLTVTPVGAPQGTLTNLVLDSPVTGGSNGQGVVVLGTFAQTASVVSLSSSNPSVASVPSTVTVQSGSQTAVFSVSTTAVSTSTTVSITATYNGGSLTRSVTVEPGAPPPPPPPPPPQNATLTVTASGRSGERITSSPAGINVAVGSSGSASFATGTSITLTVSDGRDAIFSGACSSGGSKRKTCTFTLNANASVTANVQ